MKLKKKWMGICIILACIIAIYPTSMLMNKKTTFQMSEKGFQIIHGITFPYKEGTTLMIEEEDGVEEVYLKNEKKMLSTLPIYQGKEISVLLPVSYAVVNYEQGKLEKLNRFSTLNKKDNKYLATNGKKETLLNKHFLFDGMDTYLFLEEVIISFGDTSYKISPLSYVRIVQGEEIQIYDAQNDEYIQESIANMEVQVTLDEQAILRLDTDVLQVKEKQILLYSTPTNLNNIE